MKGIFAITVFLFCFASLSGQEITCPADTITESDGQLFMPWYPGTIENSFKVAPDVARSRPSLVSLLKRKLNACSELIINDSLFHTFSGMKVQVREEIFSPDGLNEQFKWIPSSVEIGFFTTLARDSLPFWESSPDAWVTIHFNNPKILVVNPVIQNIYS